MYLGMLSTLLNKTMTASTLCTAGLLECFDNIQSQWEVITEEFKEEGGRG